MKFFRNIVMSLMVMAIAVCSIPTFAMAAEVGEMMPNCESAELVSVEYDADGSRTETYEFEITQSSTATDDHGIMPLSLDQSFNMGASHRGGDRKYSGSKLRYAVTVTDQYGNAVDNMVSIHLYDYNHSYPLHTSNVHANGSTTVIPSISITPNRTYYFVYQRTSGASRTLKVRMQITDYN